METRDEIRVDAPATLLANYLPRASFGFFVSRGMRASASKERSFFVSPGRRRAISSLPHASHRGLLFEASPPAILYLAIIERDDGEFWRYRCADGR